MPKALLNRRVFVAAGMAASASLSPIPFMRLPAQVDVAIIGAGLSGLTAARRIVEAGVHSVVVLEALDRVGGRTFNGPMVGGQGLELGGQWIGPTQSRILSLTKELGVSTFKTHTQGRGVWHMSGLRGTFGSRSLKQARTLQRALDARLKPLWETVSLSAPWASPTAQALDRQSVAQWMDSQKLSSEEREELESCTSSTLGQTPERISLLWFLFYLHSAGGVEVLESFEGGAQERRITGGSQILSLRLAQALGRKVRTESPVSSIRQQRSSILIQSKEQSFEAKQLIVAMMPKDCAKLQFSPELPEARRKLQSGWTTAGGVKTHLVYETPFWRKRKLSGLALTDNPLVESCFDNSPASGALGVLLVFSSEQAAQSFKQPSDRYAAITKVLGRCFGKLALNPKQIVDYDWQDCPSISGCVSPIKPKFLSLYGSSLRKSIGGRLHWAGTETSDIWNGYMEGAVRAGERAARDVVRALKGK